MTIENIYNNVETSTNFHNKNKTDFESFNKFHLEREKSYKKTAKISAREQLIKNLKQWDSSVPRQYSRLSLKKMNTPRSKKTIKTLVKSKNNNLFFYSEDAPERERIVYATLRDYVTMGLTSFSRVQHLTENDITVWGTVGFEGFKNINTVLNKRETNIIVIHGFTDKRYTDKEIRMLERVIFHCFYENIQLIFSSSVSYGFYSTILSAQASGILDTLISDNIINI